MSTAMYNALSTPDELLHAYIDNELDQELEPQFFTMLAADSELRSRLRQLREIRSEARRFGAVAAPPSVLTNAVFERLGFAPVPAQHPSRMVGAALLLRSAWAPAVAAVVTFLTATVIFGLHDAPSLNPSATQPRDTYAISTPSKTTTESDSPVKFSPAGADAATKTQPTFGPAPDAVHDAHQSTIPDLETESSKSNATEQSGIIATHSSESIAAGEPGTTATTGSEPTSKEASVPSATGVSDSAAAEAHAQKAPVPVSEDAWASLPAARPTSADQSANADERARRTGDGIGSISEAAVPSHVLAQQGIATPDIIDTRQYFPTLGSGPGDRFVSVELRGVSATSFPEATIGSRSNPWMENMAIGVYLGSDRNDFGVEFGQEPFSQHYSGVENGKYVRYEQNMISSWVLGGYRHRFAPWRAFGSIEPYVATGIGATLEAWPLARAGMGIMYMPDRRVRFQLGLEGTLLAFPYQDKWFTSKRAGFTYGISVLI
jgi:hypothetical protein